MRLGFALDDNEEEPIVLEEFELEVNSIVIFKMTSIISPYNFYGVLPYGPIDLNKNEVTLETPQDKELKQMSIALK